jgi:hypothetical protein
MAKVKNTKPSSNGLKVTFGSKKTGKHTKHVNKHVSDKSYAGQGR